MTDSGLVRPPARTAAAWLGVRAATPADHDAIVRLLDELELDYAGRDLAQFVVGEVEGEHGRQIAGIAELRRIGGHALLSCVGIRGDLQGRGLGRALVEGALEGVSADVRLFTLVPGFFERLGFAEGAPPPQLQREDIYDCAACEPARCRSMARAPREPRAFAPPDWDALEARLARIEQPTCDLTLAGLAIWRDCEAPRVLDAGAGECLVIESHHEPPFVLEPLGGDDPAAALQAAIEVVGRASRVRDASAALLPRERFDVVEQPEHHDYVYETARLASLQGGRHDGQRNQIRRFAKEHPRHAFRPLAPGDGPAALAVFERWSAGHAEAAAPGGAPVPSRDCQRRALARAFEGFSRLGLSGGAMTEDGVVRAFLVASRARGVADVHFLLAEPGLHGAYQALLRECCRSVLADAELVNLEEDLGIPGLRRAKTSYGPVRMARKFDVRPRPRER